MLVSTDTTVFQEALTVELSAYILMGLPAALFNGMTFMKMMKNSGPIIWASAGRLLPLLQDLRCGL